MLELLAPAGSMDALRAAVQNGANAVYDDTGIEPSVTVTLISGEDTNVALLTAEQDNQLTTAINMLAS